MYRSPEDSRECLTSRDWTLECRSRELLRECMWRDCLFDAIRLDRVRLCVRSGEVIAPAAMCSGIVNCEYKDALSMDLRSGREKLNCTAVPVTGVSGTMIVGAVAGRGKDMCFSLISATSRRCVHFQYVHVMR